MKPNVRTNRQKERNTEADVVKFLRRGIIDILRSYWMPRSQTCKPLNIHCADFWRFNAKQGFKIDKKQLRTEIVRIFTAAFKQKPKQGNNGLDSLGSDSSYDRTRNHTPYTVSPDTGRRDVPIFNSYMSE